MDARIAEGATLLAAGDPLGALKRVALLESPAGLALRGIALAQLGAWDDSKALLRRAMRAFGPERRLPYARCTVALAEVSLASRDLGAWPAEDLASAIATLETHGDVSNAEFARVLDARHALLTGRLEAAEQGIAAALDRGSPRIRAMAGLIAFEVCVRRRQARSARSALEAAHRAALQAAIPALLAEVERAQGTLARPAARLTSAGSSRDVDLAEVEALFASDALVVDGCERTVRVGDVVVSLARRPVLFSLLRTLAQAFPAVATRERLIEDAFSGRAADESHRARLRVEIGRLRGSIAPMAEVRAAGQGFELAPRTAREVQVLVPPVDGIEGVVLALMADGERWSTSALVVATGASARTIQRTLSSLEAAGLARSAGSGPSLRWVTAPRTDLASTLLLGPRTMVM